MKERVNTILINKCFANNIVPEQFLKDDLGLDSLGIVELLIALEEEFDIEIDESDLEPTEIRTVGNLYKLVNRYAGVDYDAAV